MSTRDIKTCLTAVRAAGVQLPDSVTTAEIRAGFAFPSLTTTAEAEAAVKAATTQQEYDRAVVDLQRVMAVARVPRESVQMTANQINDAILGDAVFPVLDQITDQVIERYNQAAPAFVEAVGRVPDISGLGPLDMTPQASQALLDAKAAVVPLNAAWTAFRAIQTLRGIKPPTGHDGPGASRLVGYLGDGFAGEGDHRYAVELVCGYAKGSDALSLKALAPHVAIVRAGGRLNLVTQAEAEDRWVILL